MRSSRLVVSRGDRAELEHAASPQRNAFRVELAVAVVAIEQGGESPRPRGPAMRGFSSRKPRERRMLWALASSTSARSHASATSTAGVPPKRSGIRRSIPIRSARFFSWLAASSACCPASPRSRWISARSASGAAWAMAMAPIQLPRSLSYPTSQRGPRRRARHPGSARGSRAPRRRPPAATASRGARGAGARARASTSRSPRSTERRAPTRAAGKPPLARPRVDGPTSTQRARFRRSCQRAARNAAQGLRRGSRVSAASCAPCSAARGSRPPAPRARPTSVSRVRLRRGRSRASSAPRRRGCRRRRARSAPKPRLRPAPTEAAARGRADAPGRDLRSRAFRRLQAAALVRARASRRAAASSRRSSASGSSGTMRSARSAKTNAVRMSCFPSASSATRSA